MKRLAFAAALVALLGPIPAHAGRAGTVDSAFARGANPLRLPMPRSDVAQGVAVDARERVVLAGVRDAGDSLFDGVVTRLTASGRLDRTFGRDGRAALAPEADHRILDVALAPDGKIVVVGCVAASSDFSVQRWESWVVRLTATGALDRTFNRRGSVTHAFGEQSCLYRAAVRRDGRIVIAGQHGLRGDRATFVAQYRANGSLDESFGRSGTAVLPPAMSTHPERNESVGLTLLRDGRVVLLASADGTLGGWRPVVVRLSATGMFDHTFGVLGAAYVDIADSFATALAVTPTGRIFVAANEVDGDGVVVRLAPDGGLDRSYGGNGVARPTRAWIDAMSVTSDGRAVVTGGLSDQGPYVVVRVTASGKRDVSFGRAGEVRLPKWRAWDLAVARGKVVAAGFTWTGDRDHAVTRLLL